MRRVITLSAALLALVSASSACVGGVVCTEIGCDSTLEVGYGDLVVNEPYSLTINPGGQTVSVICLSDDPDADPLPEWLECDADGFEITGELAERTTLSVTVVPLSTNEALISAALVPLTVDQVIAPNGEDCEPVCYRRVGTVPPS